ncbi:hypothetical protein OQJ05_08760 [Fluoribacter gormanii]|uniref:hypothetical protein n=1 Tax=Fluoribacter gormanii TaxID=464 RepID=UPI002244F2C8|nr:hypothetical protein [Fluoribacter gormanii]MCW8444143.1 hypothetical protein [Fluoribacter gormanii]
MQEKQEPTNINSLDKEQFQIMDLNPKTQIFLGLSSKSIFSKLNIMQNKVQHFSTLVAQGKQEEAKKLLLKISVSSLTASVSELMLTDTLFTDYSGRTFNCTAYEYAYWAKDTHMCRMLEQQMDTDTKKSMLKRCEAIEKDGLTYKQHGVEVKGSKHFDLTPLKKALTHYVEGYNNWFNTGNYTAMNAAWMAVGLAQRELPVHVINEYCRPDRSFSPKPEFDEPTLPRVLIYYDYRMHEDRALFPLDFSDSSGLGVDFALIRGGWHNGASGLLRRLGSGVGGGPSAALDLAAMSRLDEVRTADLSQSRDILSTAEAENSSGIRRYESYY